MQTRVDSKDLARRWCIAATDGAISDWHIDAAGYGTYIHMWSGMKVWTLKSDEYESEGGKVPAHQIILLPGDDLFVSFQSAALLRIAK